MTATAEQWVEPAEDHRSVDSVSFDRPPVIVIGNGPVGVHCVKQCLEQGVSGPFLVFGREPYRPYNRVQLSALLSGEVKLEQLHNALPESDQIIEYLGFAITEIDPARKRVVDQNGTRYTYSKLILATGSSPHTPNLPGVEKTGVYQFRDLRDAEFLFSRRIRSRHTVVVGGGLLGLEVAYGMLRHATQVTLIQHSPRLMNRQLNQEAAKRLQAHVEALGVSVQLNSGIQSIEGEPVVNQVTLRDGRRLSCDTLILATGIRPNLELARAAHLSVGQGVRINRQLQTSDPDIFAIGECAEYDNNIYGLVGPGLEQAAVLAQRLAGNDSEYNGSLLATELKVTGLPVYSIGRINVDSQQWELRSIEYSSEEGYRCLYIHRGRLVGALAVGEWPHYKRVQEAVQAQPIIWPWQVWRFRHNGDLWSDSDLSLAQMPSKTVICNCRQVTLGDLRSTMQENNRIDLVEIGEQCGAGTVCGSCQPLLQQLLSEKQTTASASTGMPLGLLISGLSVLVYVLAFFALGPLPVEESVQQVQWSQWWNDTTLRQWTGFTMLGMVVISMLLSARKRLSWFRWGAFGFWRWLHIGLTGLVAMILVVHTGLDTGANLNQWLLMNFLAVLLLGGAAASYSALEIAYPSLSWKAIKRRVTFMHLLLFWPLPVLISFHVLSVYFF